MTQGLFRPVTAIEVAATAATRFRSQYADWGDHDKFADGKTKGSVVDFLNSHQHTPANIASILNNGWAYPQCQCCRQYRHVAVEIKGEWADDSITLCFDCVSKAVSLLNQFPDSETTVKDKVSS